MPKYDDIKIGSVYCFLKKITVIDGNNFADLVGDFNPLHVKKDFGEKSQFKQNIVHGMLAAGLFSTLIGIYCPGKNALYLSQTLNFRRPIFYGDTLLICGTVTAKFDSLQMIQLHTEILKREEVVIDGDAKVKILEKK